MSSLDPLDNWSTWSDCPGQRLVSSLDSDPTASAELYNFTFSPGSVVIFAVNTSDIQLSVTYLDPSVAGDSDPTEVIPSSSVVVNEAGVGVLALDASRLPALCWEDACELVLVLSAHPLTVTTSSSPLRIGYELELFTGQMLGWAERDAVPHEGSVTAGSVRIYGLHVTTADLNARIDLWPESDATDTATLNFLDLDLTVCGEWAAADPVTLTTQTVGVPEYAVLLQHEAGVGLYFIQVRAQSTVDSPDGGVNDAGYVLTALRHYREWEVMFLAFMSFIVLCTLGLMCGSVVLALLRRSSGRVQATRRPRRRAFDQPEEKGLEPALLKTLPLLIYSAEHKQKEAKEEGSQDSCVICLNEYEMGDKLRVLHCEHRFHQTCGDEWLLLKRHCPLCQRDVKDMINTHRAGLISTASDPSSSSPQGQLFNDPGPEPNIAQMGDNHAGIEMLAVGRDRKTQESQVPTRLDLDLNSDMLLVGSEGPVSGARI